MEKTPEQRVARLYARIEKALNKAGYTLEVTDASDVHKRAKIRPLAYGKLFVDTSGAKMEMPDYNCAALLKALKGKVKAQPWQWGNEIHISHP